MYCMPCMMPKTDPLVHFPEYLCSFLSCPEANGIICQTILSFKTAVDIGPSFAHSATHEANCCGQLWVWHMICGQTCDGLYHLAFCLINFGIPLGSQPIKSALARHSGVQVPVIAGPLPLCSLLHGLLSRVHFGESLVVRLYSEIDHIHLISEAHCVSHLYPQVDCHRRCVVGGKLLIYSHWVLAESRWWEFGVGLRSSSLHVAMIEVILKAPRSCRLIK